MITIEHIEKYGRDLNETITIEEGTQTLTLEVNQDTMIEIAERYKYAGEQFGETGLAYAFTELTNDNRTIMWELVRMMNPTLTDGESETIYDMKRNNQELAAKMEDAIGNYAEAMLEAGRPEQTARGGGDPTKSSPIRGEVHTEELETDDKYNPTDEDERLIDILMVELMEEGPLGIDYQDEDETDYPTDDDIDYQLSDEDWIVSTDGDVTYR